MVVKILGIVQARMNSTRLPGKVLKTVGDKSLIEILLSRLSKSKKIDKIVLATSKNKENDVLASAVEKLGFEVFRGSEDDVLDRYFQTAKKYAPKTVVRITGDCPIIDPLIVDQVISLYQKESADYASNTNPPTYPDGLDVEVFSFNKLKEANDLAKTKYEREHVTPFIRQNNKSKNINLFNDDNLSNDRWTVDDPEDFLFIKNILNHFSPQLYFSWKDVLQLKKIHPDYFDINKDIKRDEGSLLGTGQKLYKRAKKIIPGGTMLLSKKPEMFLPEYWPSYFSKTKGCKVWDLDGNEFVDMSIMGIGTNTLGYSNPEVDDVVKEVISKGNMSTFNCPEEVYLAEKLISIHPWADMARFARSGGEANAIAVRIARAASGRDKVAICGYHGWHDWYLSTNLTDKSQLDGHLLPGLEPAGVPKELAGTTIPFNYNDIDGLTEIISKNDVGVVKMEVVRNIEPNSEFLKAVRKVTYENNVILIFDECTSGFRETYGGLHKKYGVEPDMIMLGKTLGNGYAITAVLGKREIMEFAKNTFISSTFWTERIGPSAALKTIEIMDEMKSWEKITMKGAKIKEGWSSLAMEYDIPINIQGLKALSNFVIPVDDWPIYKTFITQEMLKKGYLAANSVYACTEHTDDIIEEYLHLLSNVFLKIKNSIEKKTTDGLLDGEQCQSGFKRLN